MDPLSGFHPLLLKWFSAKYAAPTDAQAQALPLILRGDHVLVSAPTGSGKTLTAFLAALHKLLSGEWATGQMRVLYLSPLKALGNDIRRNLLAPLSELADLFAHHQVPFPTIKVLTRTGDTPQDERRAMLRRPPEILITTPESLGLMLTGKRSRDLFAGLRAVIVDEIHAIAGTKRGTYALCQVERLTLAASEFQRIGLSATVRPEERIAAWMGGFLLDRNGNYAPRPVTVVRSQSRRPPVITLKSPAPPDPSPTSKDEFWAKLTVDLKATIASHRSTLIFANSRRTVEKIVRLLNEGEPEILAYSHHGSLSRELRLSVEEQMKAGRLRAIVATGSLELGIDIGTIDEVILLGAPPSLSQAIQRIGRADHRVGGQSRAQIVALHGLDGVETATLLGLLKQGVLEETCPIQKPLDVLAQVLLSMGCQTVWEIERLFAFIRTISPYHDLSRASFDEVMAMLTGRFADAPLQDLRPRATLDPVKQTFTARAGTEFVLYQSGGTIPDRGYYHLRLADTKALLGELDEEFVWERRLGEQFTFGTQTWRILRITHNDVEVGPADPARPMIPFWKAEAQNRSTLASLALLDFLDICDLRIGDPSFLMDLECRCGLPSEATTQILAFLQTQKDASGGVLPGRHRIVVECTRDDTTDLQKVILHTFWGGRVNRPLAFALAEAWEKEQGAPLEVFANNDQILILLPDGIDPKILFRDLAARSIEPLLRSRLQNTPLFGAHFRENAARALLLPRGDARRRYPLWLGRLRAKKLLAAVSQLPDFPIVLETWRDLIEDEFDLPSLSMLLDQVTTGEIQVEVIRPPRPTPFCAGIFFQQTNYHMYLDDSPVGGKLPGPSSERLHDLFSAGSFPQFPKELLDRFQGKSLRLSPGYEPTTREEVAYAIQEMVLVPVSQVEAWLLPLDPLPDDSPDPLSTFVRFTLPGASVPLVTALADLPRILWLRGNSQPQDLAPLLPSVTLDLQGFLRAHPFESETESAATLLEDFLHPRGPVTPQELTQHLGFSEDELFAFGDELGEDIVVRPFLAEDPQVHFCDGENADRLLRLFRAERRREIAREPRPLSYLPAYLAALHGMNSPASDLPALQKCLDRLFGYPLPASLWEEGIFPTRLHPYHPSWLDSLFQSYGLTWIGTGPDRLTFSLADDALLLLPTTDAPTDPPELFNPLAGQTQGFTLADVAQWESTFPNARTTVWDWAFLGHFTTDSFEPLRRRLRGELFEPSLPTRGSRFARGAGWKKPASFLFRPLPKPTAESPLDDALMEADRARIVLGRYGIVFRELLERELPLLRWSRLFHALRLLELSGEIHAGHFFTDVPGLQFATREALDLVWAPFLPTPVVAMNACDPASPCGLGFSAFAHFPRRLPTNWMVLKGPELLLTLVRDGKELTFQIPPDHPDLPQAIQVFRLLSRRKFHPLTLLRVETINGVRANLSPYSDHLRTLGFRADHRSMELEASTDL